MSGLIFNPADFTGDPSAADYLEKVTVFTLGEITCADRMTAERDFPTILSVFERLFNPEINETA
jgi:hypothetical protein